MIHPDVRFAIRGTTQLLGVIGDPIKHSLSPVMQNAAIAHLGLDYVFLPFHIQPQNLAEAIAGFTAIGVRGFNVTLPHKQAILPFLSEVTDVARAVGAVNTVWRTETGWSGTNTDVEGFLAPLLEQDRDWQHSTAIVLGNGGAARAVVAGCAQLGCQKVWVVGRDRHKLDQFAQSWHASPLQVNLAIQAWDQLAAIIDQADLLINTTPIGMAPQADASPLEADLLAQLPTGAIAYDLIYTPRPTRFLQLAQAAGAAPLDGLEMLVQQGAAALQRWVQHPAPVDIMRNALLDYLAQKQSLKV